METTYDVTAEINMPLTRIVGSGDADINSRDGRSTRVSVGWHLRKRNNDGQQGFDVTFWCEVAEGHKDYTRLSNGFNNKLLSVDCDPNVEIVKAPEGDWSHSALDHNWSNSHGFSRPVHGKQHDWINWTGEPFVKNARFTRFFIKIDGPGRDDRGNCAVEATLRFPVTTRPKQSAQSAPYKFELPGNKIFRIEVADYALQAWRNANPKRSMTSVRKSRRVRRPDD